MPSKFRFSSFCFYKQGGPSHKSLTLGKLVQETGGQGEGKLISKPKPTSKDAGGGVHARLSPGQESHKSQLKQDSSSPPFHHCSTGSLHFPKSSWFHSSDPSLTVRQLSDNHANTTGEVKEPLPSLFYKQSGPSLSLFKKNRSQSVEEQSNVRLYPRRRSEPVRQVMDRASTLTLARPPSDPGLKVTEVDSQGGTTEARFCLSPYATKAVRDYFCSHPYSSPQSSQQVALALVESRRKWRKRCTDPTAEPDLDQLLFSEESYV